MAAEAPDLKPGNVMIVPDMAGPGGERVKLLDFGIAKLGAAHQNGEEVNTRTGQIMGTAAYMSPEQFGGHKPIDGQSDVYSLACLIFRLLTGQQPFVSDSGEMAVAAMHMFKPPPLDVLAAQATPWLVALVESMMRKEPTERPTMAQVAMLFQEQLPDYAQSRKSMPSGSVPSLRDPSVSGRRSLESLLKSLPEGSVSSDQMGRSSQPGTISRASGQAVVPPTPPAATGSRIAIFFGTLVVLGLFGGGTAFVLRSRNKPAPSPEVVVARPAPVVAAAAPPVVDGGSTTKPIVAAPVPTLAPEPTEPEPAPEPTAHRERSAAKTSKSGSRQGGKARSRTSHATQIIN